MPVIYPVNPDESKLLAQMLIELAGDEHAERVQIVTDGEVIPGFLVDDDLLAVLEAGDELSDPAPDDTDQGGDPDNTNPDAEAQGDQGEPEPSVKLSELDSPHRGASRDDWAEFMATVPGAGPTEGKKRDQLIDEWESLLATETTE